MYRIIKILAICFVTALLSANAYARQALPLPTGSESVLTKASEQNAVINVTGGQLRFESPVLVLHRLALFQRKQTINCLSKIYPKKVVSTVSFHNSIKLSHIKKSEYVRLKGFRIRQC